MRYRGRYQSVQIGVMSPVISSLKVTYWSAATQLIGIR